MIGQKMIKENIPVADSHVNEIMVLPEPGSRDRTIRFYRHPEEIPVTTNPRPTSVWGTSKRYGRDNLELCVQCDTSVEKQKAVLLAIYDEQRERIERLVYHLGCWKDAWSRVEGARTVAATRAGKEGQRVLPPYHL